MSENLIRRIKNAIRRRLKAFELEEGISLSLQLKKERWDFIIELLEHLNKNTIYLVKGYTLMCDILIPLHSGKLLKLSFFISYDGYSVHKPYFDRYWEIYRKIKEPTLIIEPSFSLNSARNKYNEFVRLKGLTEENEYLSEIIFTLDESEYKLIEFLV
jgi:hypothetical protein